MSNTLGAALAQLLNAQTNEEREQAQIELDATRADLIQKAKEEGISMEIETTFSEALIPPTSQNS